jgi:AcrR family transcriptional regulator
MSQKTDEIAIKQKLVTAAITIYIEDKTNLSVTAVAKKTRIKKADIFKLFPSTRAILNYFYSLCILRYREMIKDLDDFDGWEPEERLANFAYAMFDLLGEEREFIDLHFRSDVFPYSDTRFHRDSQKLFEDLIGNVCCKEWVGTFLAKEYMHVVYFWLNDDSDDSERSIALVDKTTAFIGEGLRSEKLVLKGADLVKYLVTNNVIKVPFPNNVLTKFLNWIP